MIAGTVSWDSAGQAIPQTDYQPLRTNKNKTTGWQLKSKDAEPKINNFMAGPKIRVLNDGATVPIPYPDNECWYYYQGNSWKASTKVAVQESHGSNRPEWPQTINVNDGGDTAHFKCPCPSSES